MNIYDRLKKDHEKQRDLCAKLLKTEGDSDERHKLWEMLRVELEAHALAEEQTFYAELMEHPDATEQARHSVAEHKDMADLVEELEKTEMSSGGWLQKFKKLSHDVNHHVDEEEEDVFPLGKKVIGDKRADELASEFNERKPAEVKKEQAA